MPHYEYQARNASGEVVKGTIEAPTASRAVIELEAQGLTVVALGQAALGQGEAGGSSDGSQRPASQSELLQELLARAMQESSAVLPALRALAAEKPAKARRRSLHAFIALLEQGDVRAASASFGRLAEYWIPLIAASRAREPSAALVRFFKEWGDIHQINLHARLALSYGFIVISVAAVVMTGVCLFIVPTFADIFAGFGLRVPGLTRLVITLSQWVVSGRILAAIALGILLLGLLWLAVRLLPERLKAAVGDRFGTFFGRSAALARFTSSAADLLDAEVQPALAIRLAAAASQSPRLERAAGRWQPLEPGNRPRAAALRPLIPATVQHAFEPGIADAARIALLRDLSRVYAERAMARSSWTRGIIEPLAVLFVGLNVGLVVLALFLPLISLIQGLS